MESDTVPSNHFQDIMLRLDNDRKSSAKYCDITLIVDEHEYPAHKCIFGLLSPFFDKMFSIEMKERYDNEAVIKGVSKEVFEAILDLIYAGSVTLNMENVFGIIEAAHYMDFPYVKNYCTAYLAKNITADNWLNVKSYGIRYDYEELLEKLDESLAEKFTDFVNAQNFAYLKKDDLKHLLGLKKKKVESEKVFESVIGWIKHDAINREKCAEEFFNCVDFTEMSLDFLTEVVANEKLIGDSRLCSKLVLDAIGLLSVIEKPRISRPCGLALRDFVAVDGKRVMKVTSHDLQKLPLKHDHTGGSAVKGRFVYVIGGCKTKEMEGVEIENFGFSTDATFNCTKKLRYGAA